MTFESAQTEIEGLGRVILYDSPGLADPNLSINKWSDLFNTNIAQKGIGIDLVVCVIEYAERPSYREKELFVVLS